MDNLGMDFEASEPVKWLDELVHATSTKPRCKFLTFDDIAVLVAAARHNRYGDRDATMIYLAYKHAMRPSEICALTWDEVHLRARPYPVLDIFRVRSGSNYQHSLAADEVAMLRRLRREKSDSPFIFASMRGKPLTPAGFGRILERVGKAAGFDVTINAAMLRDSCGRALARDGNSASFVRRWLGVGPKASVKRFMRGGR
jgi:integrase